MPGGRCSADIPDKEIVTKLFDVIAPRFAGRPGGYTRILRTGFRRGDSAETAQARAGRQRVQPEGRRREEVRRQVAVEGVMRGRLAAAAERLRGRRAGGEEPEEESETPAKAKGKRGKAEDEE